MKPPVDAPASRARRPAMAHGEAVQRRGELPPAAADEGRRGPEHDDRLVRRHEARRLLGRRAGDEDAARGDGRLGLRSGGDEAAAHELGVEPAAGPGAQLAALLGRLVSGRASGWRLAGERPAWRRLRRGRLLAAALGPALAFLAAARARLGGRAWPGERTPWAVLAGLRWRTFCAVCPAGSPAWSPWRPACRPVHVAGGLAARPRPTS